MLERMSSNWNFHALLTEVQNRAKMESCVTFFFFGNILSINFFWLFTCCYQSHKQDLYMNTHSHFIHGKHKHHQQSNRRKVGCGRL